MIQSLEEIKIITEKYLSEFNNIKKVDLKTVFESPNTAMLVELEAAIFE